MGENTAISARQTRRHAKVRAAIFAVLGLLSFQAAAEPLTLYLYKERGHPVYSNVPPEGIPYTVVIPGNGAPRPVLSMEPVSAAAEEIEEKADAKAAVETGVAVTAVGWAASCKGVTKAMLDERAEQFQDLVSKHAKAHGVPAALVSAVMRVESCFNHRAVSRVGARGLMQLMPATAAELGVRDSFDADQNIGGGVRYLGKLLDRFNNNTKLAIAAYNAGPSAVDAYNGIPPFAQTRSYVDRVIAAYHGNSETKVKAKASTKPQKSVS